MVFDKMSWTPASTDYFRIKTVQFYLFFSIAVVDKVENIEIVNH